MNENLLRAAEYIDQHGWCQEEINDTQGRVCLYGALDAVTDQNTFRKYGIINGEFNVARNHLGKFVEQIQGIPLNIKEGYDNIIYFNDFVLTSAEEASKVLREAAEWTLNE